MKADGFKGQIVTLAVGENAARVSGKPDGVDDPADRVAFVTFKPGTPAPAEEATERLLQNRIAAVDLLWTILLSIVMANSSKMVAKSSNSGSYPMPSKELGRSQSSRRIWYPSS